MLQTIRKAFQIEDIRKRLFYTFIMLIVVRLGSELPTPGVNPEYIQGFFENQTGDSDISIAGLLICVKCARIWNV